MVSVRLRLRMKTLARGETRRGGVPGRDARGGETHVTDALGPDSLVELHVNAHVRGLHGLLGELLHLCVRERGGWGQRCFLARDDGWKTSRRRVRRKTGPRRRSEGCMRRDNAGARSARVASRSCTSRRRRGAVARPRTPANARAVALENRACSVAGEGTHRSHRTGSPLLEGDPMNRLGEVDGVFTRNDVLRLRHGCRVVLEQLCASQRGRTRRADLGFLR